MLHLLACKEGVEFCNIWPFLRKQKNEILLKASSSDSEVEIWSVASCEGQRSSWEASGRKHHVAPELVFSTNPGLGESASLWNYPSGLCPVLTL